VKTKSHVGLQCKKKKKKDQSQLQHRTSSASEQICLHYNGLTLLELQRNIHWRNVEEDLTSKLGYISFNNLILG
jgi:hypothetical protein